MFQREGSVPTTDRKFCDSFEELEMAEVGGRTDKKLLLECIEFDL